MAAKRKIKWDDIAIAELDKLFAWIEKDSIQNAEKITDLIIEKVDRLEFNPEQFSLDRFKKANNGKYRAIEIKSIRLTIRVSRNSATIMHVRHVRKSSDFH